MTLHPLVIPHLVSRTAGGICILSQLCSDHSCESAAGFQHALSQGPSNQPPLSAALPNNLPGHGAMSKMWEKYLCCSLSYKHGHSRCSFPLYPWNAGKSLLDLPGWQHLGSFWSTPAPAIFAQVHPSLHSWEQITYQPDSTEKTTPELRNADFMSSGLNSSPPQRNTTKTTGRAKKTGNEEPGRRGQPGEEQGARSSEVIWDCHNLPRFIK